MLSADHLSGNLLCDSLDKNTITAADVVDVVNFLCHNLCCFVGRDAPPRGGYYWAWYVVYPMCIFWIPHSVTFVRVLMCVTVRHPSAMWRSAHL